MLDIDTTRLHAGGKNMRSAKYVTQYSECSLSPVKILINIQSYEKLLLHIQSYVFCVSSEAPHSYAKLRIVKPFELVS